LRLNGLNASVAGRIVRFVRLWRKLGWNIFDLDRVITALGGDLTAEFLTKLAHVSRLQTLFNLAVDQLPAFWAPLDTFRYGNSGDTARLAAPSLYERLFRSRTSLNPLDPAFTENPAALTGKLTDHAETIAAALELSAADLSTIVRSDGIFPSGIDTGLNLDALSQLYWAGR
jgi:hypothetical protein